MLKNSAFLAVVCCLVSTSAAAQFMMAQARFSSESAELKTILLDPEKGIIAASAVVVQGACSGSLAGIGTIKGKSASITPYSKLPGGEKCTLEIKFSPDWKKATLVENEYCSAYHGASCQWEGQEVKRKSER